MRGMENASRSASFAKRVIAVLVLAVAAWLLMKIVISAAVAIAWFVAVIVAIVAIIWAVRTL